VTAVEVISFGYGHGGPPPAHLTIDVRAHFRDPHVSPELRYLTAADAPVVEAVMSTPGVPALIDSTTAAVAAFRAAPAPGPVTVAIGCVGGRHRSAAIAAEVARRLGPAVTLIHRDINRPVINRAAPGRTPHTAA
jgi:RNase adaptor protein for sRNA GlmZ degradation